MAEERNMTRSELKRANAAFLGLLFLHHFDQLGIVPQPRDEEYEPINTTQPEPYNVAAISPADNNFKFPMMQQIIATTSDVFKVGINEIMSIRRHPRIVTARQVAMFLCLEITNKSLGQVGRVFGRDHTTVLHAKHRILGMIDRYPAFRADVDVIRMRIQDEILTEVAV